MRYAPAVPDLEALAASSGGETGRAAFEALAAIGGDAGRDALRPSAAMPAETP
jgi:hypothetical protein